MSTTNAKMQQRRDTAANWTSLNPILTDGEIGFETDKLKFKIGNGILTWNLLPYSGSAPRRYLALISQSGTSAPTSIIIENTLGAVPTFSYGSVGHYTLLCPGTLSTPSLCAVFVGSAPTAQSVVAAARIDGDSLALSSYDIIGAAYTNGIFGHTSLEILAYGPLLD